jgi:hypothetical protein
VLAVRSCKELIYVLLYVASAYRTVRRAPSTERRSCVAVTSVPFYISTVCREASVTVACQL